MTVDKAPAEKIGGRDGPLDVDNLRSSSARSTYSSSKRISSSSTSSSEKEREEVGDIDIDSDNDSEGLSVSSEISKESNESPATESEKFEEFDRETILNQVVDLADSEDKYQIIQDLIAWKFGPEKLDDKISSRSSEVSGNTKMRRKSLIDGLRETLEAVPDSLLHLMIGWFRPGDCGRPTDEKPVWFDVDKFHRGQKFVKDNMFPVLYAELISLLAIFSFDDGLKPLVITGRSSTPYAAYKRYLSTVMRLRRWFTQDPWAKGTAAWKDIAVTRAMHDATRRKMNASTVAEIDAATIIPEAWCPARDIALKDFSEICEAPAIGQCPYVIGRNNPNRPKGIGQTDMAIEQWSFVGLLILFPKRFGVHYASDEDLEAYCHVWRCLGYRLGMEDRYNFCRGSLKEIRQRSKDVLDSWVKPNFREITPEWEHIGRCVISSMTSLVPLATYETMLLHLLDIMNLQMPRLYASLSYTHWFLYNFVKYFCDYALKIPGMSSLINKILNLILDRAGDFTPEKMEAARIKFLKYPVKSS